MSTPILNFTFHGIGEPPEAIDGAERDVWVSQPDFSSTLDAICARPGTTISFDDGNKSDITIGLPALIDRDVPAYFFVVSDRVDTPGYVTGEDLRTLHEAGMRVGLHGMHHQPWRGLGDDELDEEIFGAKRTLEAELGGVVDVAACPFGSYDRRVLKRLHRAGFSRVFSSDGGQASADAWLQPRNTLRAGVTPADIERIAAGHGASRFRRAKTIVKRLR